MKKRLFLNTIATISIQASEETIATRESLPFTYLIRNFQSLNQIIIRFDDSPSVKQFANKVKRFIIEVSEKKYIRIHVLLIKSGKKKLCKRDARTLSIIFDSMEITNKPIIEAVSEYEVGGNELTRVFKSYFLLNKNFLPVYTLRKIIFTRYIRTSTVNYFYVGYFSLIPEDSKNTFHLYMKLIYERHVKDIEEAFKKV